MSSAPQPYAPQWTPTPAAALGRSSSGETLILVGAIIGLVLLGLGLLMTALMFTVFSALEDEIAGRPDGPPAGFFQNMGWMMIIMSSVFGVLNIVGAVLGLSGRKEIRQTNGASGSVKAIVGGALMIAGNLIGGVLMLIGAILCNTAKDRTTYAAPPGQTY